MPATASAKDKESPAYLVMTKSPEELQAASQKLMNFWVGAATPLWLPFLAATSFGIGTWALTQAVQRQQDLLKDMPLGNALGGFWLASERAAEALAVAEARLATKVAVTDTAEAVAQQKADALSDPQGEISKTAAALMNESIVMAAKTIESVTEAVEAAAKPPKAPSEVSKASPADSVVAVETPKPASRRRPARKT